MAQERVWDGHATEGEAPEVSIVAPVYRNRESLEELYRRLQGVLDGRSYTFEVLFVDDACPEDSTEALRELARSDNRLFVLKLDQNIGQQRAVLEGLKLVRGKWVVVIDADLQDPPEVIPDLLERLREGPAVVFAARRGRYESTARLLTSRLFKWLLRLLCGVPRGAGLFLAMKREVCERLLEFTLPHPHIVAMIGLAGFPLGSVPVVRERRAVGRSAYTSWKRFKTGFLAITWVLFEKSRYIGHGKGSPRRKVC